MDTIHVKPAPGLLRPFAQWAVAQNQKLRTTGPSEFAVPASLFPAVPEELLLGALVDGQPYVPRPAEARLLDCGLCYEEDGEEVHPHPECTASEQGVAGPVGADPGEALPELPEQANGPDAVLLAPLDDTPAAEEDGAAEAAPAGHPCPDCDRPFASERGLAKHRARQHAA
ncbi:hypothetical protein [Kitasatospora aureofaciens]|uniref:hypothetical protein n=1 Tax=Kitasatospora aureofaciens TaxID=1894 RepID=UPI0033FFBDB1